MSSAGNQLIDIMTRIYGQLTLAVQRKNTIRHQQLITSDDHQWSVFRIWVLIFQLNFTHCMTNNRLNWNGVFACLPKCTQAALITQTLLCIFIERASISGVYIRPLTVNLRTPTGSCSMPNVATSSVSQPNSVNCNTPPLTSWSSNGRAARENPSSDVISETWQVAHRWQWNRARGPKVTATNAGIFSNPRGYWNYSVSMHPEKNKNKLPPSWIIY